MSDLPSTDNHHVPAASARSSNPIARVVRALAGSATGWHSRRRGSFLVIVVGTLALLAVLTIIYSSIGNHDVRMRTSVESHQQLEDVPEQVRDYLARIIADSTVSVSYDTKFGLTGGIVPVSRVTFDFPSTAWNASSSINGGNLPSVLPQFPFNPTGSVGGFEDIPDYTGRAIANMPASWSPSTPWLADTEPVFLDFAGAGTTSADLFLSRRDWAHISNIAPDGRFVNLYNIRNNPRAASGMGANATSADSTLVYLFNAAGGVDNKTDFGKPLTPALVHQPAYLDSRQQWLFRLAKPTASPSQPFYEDYLYADADGDGMYDSRWQELVDARTEFLRNYLTTSGNYRYFVAVRIIDASGLVNVNTATDLRVAPSVDAPIGLTAADVDLRRVLTMNDVYGNSEIGYGPVANVGGGIFNPIPNDPTQYTNYSEYDDIIAFNAGQYGYNALRLTLAGTIVPPLTNVDRSNYRGPYRGEDLSQFAVGDDFNAPLTGWDFSTYPQANRLRAAYYATAARATTDASRAGSAAVTFNGSFGMQDMYELLERRCVNDPDITSTLEYAFGGRIKPTGGTVPPESVYSPLRSNRQLPEETRRYTWDNTGNMTDPTSNYGRTMQLFDADIRQRLTTDSGARQLRMIPAGRRTTNSQAVNPHELDVSELRIDARRALDDASTVPPATVANPYGLPEEKQVKALRDIFQGYADALLPFSSIGQPWGRNPAEYSQRRTLSYGYNPMLALHAAAHMAVNMVDMYDKDSQPTIETLLINGQYRTLLTGTTPSEFSTWNEFAPALMTNPTALQRPLELDAARLPQAADNVASTVPANAATIYGIEPQPFLTQVSTFTVYGDNENRTGDDEGSESTISGTDPDDLMYRVIAFQLYNPSSVDITLGGALEAYSAATAGTKTRYAPSADYNIADSAGLYPRLNRESNYYYIRFGDRAYKLSAIEEPVFTTLAAANALHTAHRPAVGGTPEEAAAGAYNDAAWSTAYPVYVRPDPLVIPAGQSIVCYALSDRPHDILQKRFAGLTSSSGDTSRAASWLETMPGGGTIKRKQMRQQIKDAIEGRLGKPTTGGPANTAQVSGVYWIPQFDLETGDAIIKRDPIPAVTGASTVELWKAVRTSSVTPATGPTTAINEHLRDVNPTPAANPFWDGTTVADPATVSQYAYVEVGNRPENDQLMDRLRVPDSSALAPVFDAGEHHLSPSDPMSDNEVFVVGLWGTYSRPANPTAEVPLGAVPAFCLEPKFVTAWNTLADNSQYSRSGDLSNLSAGTTGPSSQFKGVSRSLQYWFESMSDVLDSNYMGNRISRAPQRLDTAPIPNSPATPSLSFTDTYIELCANNAQFMQGSGATARSVLRPADMLLPLGIGPEEMPYVVGGPVVDPELRYTTLGEALALSLGYQGPVPTNTVDATFAYTQSTMTLPLDRGQLRLDQFVPFFDSTNNGVFNPTDARVGLQIPAALAVLDTFSVNPVFANDATAPVSWNSLQRPVPGTISINTVPLNTARAAIPLLAPAPETEPTPGVPTPWGWYGRAAGDPSNTQLDATVDIAASLFAYRNKGDGYLRPTVVIPGFSNNLVSFTEGNAGTFPDAADGVLSGRAEVTQVNFDAATSTPSPALHEQPGFRSIGELLAVRARDSAIDSPGRPFNMDFLGFDERPPKTGYTSPADGITYANGEGGHIGFDSILYKNPSGSASDTPPASNPTLIPTNLKNGYRESLALVNGVLNSVSTRSDYFICWFLLRGYQDSDCKNLGADDVMTASINRRFVMVVDRSSVYRRGQQPKILLFKEVPVDP